jgi:Fur family iron response transcriptional regulator
MNSISPDRLPLSKAEVLEVLLEHGIKPTRQRIEIAYYLFQKQQHLAAEQVLGAVNRRRAFVSKATVYNTLGLFVSKGLIREVLVDPERIFYDSNTTPHHHLYNVDTGELVDLAVDEVSILGAPELPPGTEVASVDVMIHLRNQQQE